MRMDKKDIFPQIKKESRILCRRKRETFPDLKLP